MLQCSGSIERVQYVFIQIFQQEGACLALRTTEPLSQEWTGLASIAVSCSLNTVHSMLETQRPVSDSLNHWLSDEAMPLVSQSILECSSHQPIAMIQIKLLFYYVFKWETNHLNTNTYPNNSSLEVFSDVFNIRGHNMCIIWFQIQVQMYLAGVFLYSKSYTLQSACCR